MNCKTYSGEESNWRTAFGFLASTEGRTTRIVAGVILIGIGLTLLGGTWGHMLAVVGLVPLAAGAFDFCVFAPLARFPFQGPRPRDFVREQAARPKSI